MSKKLFSLKLVSFFVLGLFVFSNSVFAMVEIPAPAEEEPVAKEFVENGIKIYREKVYLNGEQQIKVERGQEVKASLSAYVEEGAFWVWLGYKIGEKENLQCVGKINGENGFKGRIEGAEESFLLKGIDSLRLGSSYDVTFYVFDYEKTKNECNEEIAVDTFTLEKALYVVGDPIDNTSPILTLLGDEVVDIYQGDEYKDAGYTADDDWDGDLTDQVVVKGDVDTDVIGSYKITYTVSDKASNTSEKTRTVNVLEKKEETNEDTGGSDDTTTRRRASSSGSYVGNALPQVLGASTENKGEVLGEEKFIFTQFMKRGMKSGEIPKLQEFLNAKGYTCGAVDGIFGPKTESCVKEFQKANPPLKVDGIVGIKTRAVLNK